MTVPARTPKGVVVSGPLAEYAPGFAAELGRRGFMPLSALHQMRLLAHLSRWMDVHGLGVGQLTEARVDEFLVERRANYTSLYSRAHRTTPADGGRTREVEPALLCVHDKVVV